MTANKQTTDSMPSADIDAYLATLPDDKRAALQSLRQAIAAAAPGAVEAISYGAPAFKVGGRPLVAYNAAKHHCAFYVMSPAVMEAHQADLQGYDTSKGAIRFPPGKPLPAGLVAKLVGARLAEIEAGTTR